MDVNKKRVGRTNCSVVGCSNSYSTDQKAKFYCFPNERWHLQRRLKWIQAVKRVNPDGRNWKPKKHSRICSRHFFGGKKTDNPGDPSYYPTIFPHIANAQEKSAKAQKRFERLTARREIYEQNSSIIQPEESSTFPMFTDAAMQTDIDIQSNSEPTMLFCCIDGNNTACQTNIKSTSSIGIQAGSPPKTMNSVCVGPDRRAPFFNGYLSVQDDEEAMRDFTGTRCWIHWPNHFSIKTTLPSVFKIHYPKCVGIIDCTEIFCERPPNVHQRVQMYSSYKSNFTMKYLICISPSGYISFLSQGFGGKCTNSFITVNSGILNFIKPGDILLADKGFPQIKSSVEDHGAVLVMPPFAKGDGTPFSEEECNETYNIASVRIHVERAIQRIKLCAVLKKVTHDLTPDIDKIVYMAAVLANLQPPIIKQ